MDQNQIYLKGCRENNLRNISLTIPKRKITVFTGVSGSGKSSVVFDTIAQEAGRQLNETYPSFTRLFLPRYKSPDADSIENLSVTVAVDQTRLGGNARSTVGTITDINPILRILFSRFATPHIGYGNAYSFNDPDGMCPECEGIGRVVTFDPHKAIDFDKSLNEGAILLPGMAVSSMSWKFYAGTGFFDLDMKIRDYPPEILHKLVDAKAEKIVTNFGKGEINTTYEGLGTRFMRTTTQSDRDRSDKWQKSVEQFTTTCLCSKCEGKRYSQKTLDSKLMGYSIYDMTQMQPGDLISALRKLDDPAAKNMVESLCQRLQTLIDIGLDYVQLTRETTTLSGGESQRIKMMKHLFSSLSDILYIFDEPSVGLHPSDVFRMNQLLCKLRDTGNTVLVVEHDPDVIQIADHVIDMGPKAGVNGGEVVFEGSYEELKKADTLTGKFLRVKQGRKSSPRPATKEFYESAKSNLHNLQNISLRVPKGLFTVVTGVAGSGKSTLVNEVFAKKFDNVVHIDQSPASANSRSNTATFTGIFDSIRKCFAQANGVSAGLFSFNSEGACPACKGTGSITLNLSFMDVMEVECEECQGSRYRQDVLSYLYKGKNILKVLRMTAQEAIDFLEDKAVRQTLESVIEVGLGYMTLGQPLSTLSGGECQRLKLAKELGKKGNIYILDEPTTGLHLSDIQNILAIIDRLVDKGNTVVVIEHNLAVIEHADWMIDMGPQGGNKGGRILAEGPLYEVMQCQESVTAKYLRAAEE